jgi:ubiquinone/menaquinone biosynthesis C-methylase UbiE
VGDWDQLYAAHDAFGRIMQYRAELVQQWVSELALPLGARALDIGAGTAYVSAALARSGVQVVAVDRASGMVRTARRRATDPQTRGRLAIAQADARGLPFRDAQFDLVLALGVIMWLAEPVTAVREMRRVVRHDGHVLIHAINSRRIDYMLDRWMRPDHSVQSAQALQDLLLTAGFEPVRRATFGYGPFTLAGRTLLPGRLGGFAQVGVQKLANGPIPALDSVAGHHLVLGRTA